MSILLSIPDMDVRKMWVCNACNEIQEDEPEEDAVYECSNCGNFKRSDTDNGNHQCPQCKKFGSKVTGSGPLCPECEEGICVEQDIDVCDEAGNGCDWHGNPGETDSDAYIKHFLEEHAEEVARV